MKKLLATLVVLCMVCTFTPVFADSAYVVKGLAEGDIVPISALANNPTQRIYVVNSDATGVKPTNATGLDSVDFYVDGSLVGSSNTAPYYYDIPLTAGNHALRVVANPTGEASSDIGTYNYTVVATTDTSDSVIADFDSETIGSAVTFGDERSFAANESVTYQTSPAGSTAISFASTAGSGTNYIIPKSVPVPSSKIVTFDYDFYFANSSGCQISHHFRNGVPGYTFGTIASSASTKEEWHHVSYVFDFNSLTFRGYLDGYEMQRGTLNDTASNKIRFYMNRYSSAAVLYVDNFKYCGKETVAAFEPTTYAVKGIVDGERIPVGAKASTLKRTISIVNADATGKTVTEATNITKADFYIDGVLAGTATSNPCQWDLPMTDLNQHSLTITTTDAGGLTQNFGPFTYTAVNMADDSTSHTQYFDGTAGDGLTLAGLTRMNASSSSTENPEYATVAGGTGTVLKLTGASGKSSNYQTAQDIHVLTAGITTMDVDFYCTQKSSNHKLYFRARNSSGYNMKSGNMTMVDGLSMGDLTANTWHHISFIFDASSATYVFILDGYEFERGAMDSRTADRNIYFQIATQNSGSCVWYFDNIEILSKSVSANDAAGITDEGTTASAVVINSGNASKSFDAYRAEYDAEGILKSVSRESVDLAAKGIWQSALSTVATVGTQTGIFLWDYDTLAPLTDALIK